MSAADSRGAILLLENVMRAMPDAQVHIEPKHHFTDGLYAREIFVPKDLCGTGKIHLFGHLTIIVSGEASVMTDEGMKRIKGPSIFTSPAGVKRAVYVHEDTHWITVHACNAKTHEEAERLLVVDTFEELEQRLGGDTCHSLR